MERRATPIREIEGRDEHVEPVFAIDDLPCGRRALRRMTLTDLRQRELASQPQSGAGLAVNDEDFHSAGAASF
jgi:hypothetical protein